jgi:hypothetical protein
MKKKKYEKDWMKIMFFFRNIFGEYLREKKNRLI